MTYLVAQIWLFLLLAGLIGSVIGWILRGGCKQQIRELEEGWKSKYLKLKKAHDRNGEENKRLMRLSVDRNRLLLEVKKLRKNKKENDQLSTELERMKEGVRNIGSIQQRTSHNLEKNMQLLSFAKQSIKAKGLSVEKLQEQLTRSDSGLSECQQELAACQAELNSQNMALEDQTESNEKMHISQVRLVEMESELAESKAEKESLAEKLTQAEQELGNMTTQLDLFKAQGEKYIVGVTQDNEQKQSVIESQQAEIEKLIAEVQNKELMISALQGLSVSPGDAISDEDGHSPQGKEDEVKSDMGLESDESVSLPENENSDQDAGNATPLVATGSTQDDSENSNKVVKIPRINLLNRVVRLSLESPGLNLLNRPGKMQSKKKHDASMNAGEEPIGVLHNIEFIRGIGEGYGHHLKAMGIHTTADLYRYLVRDGNDLSKVSELTGVDEQEIGSWGVMADLLRIQGIDNEQAKSLELAGVKSVEDLAAENLARLAEKLTQVRQQNRRLNAEPDESDIGEWIRYAQLLISGEGDSLNQQIKGQDAGWKRIKHFRSRKKRR